MNKDNLLLNKEPPMVMHIDLNSCFAIIEQQANRLLRGRPVGVSAYDTPRGFVLAASYEAKAKGIALGVNVAQARAMCPDIVIMTPDPAKYRAAHKLFKELMLEYTPDVVPKSIDEFVLDMKASPALRSRTNNGASHNEAMLSIGTEMKQKIRERLGEWVTVNVGIATNRFLAKYAAGFGKPDGMTLIDHTNLRKWYACGTNHDHSRDGPWNEGCKSMSLVDLPGINTRYRARLRAAGIYTPLEFLDADMNKLKKQVFKSINGYHWYMRLRGYEADAVEFSTKSIGHQHALKHKTTDMPLLERLLMKLCEKTGRRLRKNNYYAGGIHLYIGFVPDQPDLDGPAGFETMYKLKSWHHGEKVYHRLYSTQDIYHEAKRLLRTAEISNKVKIMSVHVFDLNPWSPEQLSIFDIESEAEGIRKERKNFSSVTAGKRISDAVDTINNRYGEFVITPALMIEMQGEILDRIAFGQVRDL